MKKILAVLLMAAFAVAAVGCGPSKSTPADGKATQKQGRRNRDQKAPAPGPVAPTPAPPATQK